MRSATRKKTHQDKSYLEWLHLQPCIVSGRYGVTVHHVRQFGGPRADRRGLPLVRELHQLGWKIKGQPCVEEGKAQFEKFWNVDLEEEILKHNRRYEAERKAAA